MATNKFDDECAGCKPAMMNVRTGVTYPDDHPTMIVVLRLWSETTLEERQAWHRFTCQSSRAIDDLKFAQIFSQRVEAAMRASNN